MRISLLVLLFTTYLFGLINRPIHTPVISVDNEKNLITVETSKQMRLGMSGILMHWFDKEHSTALAWTEIVKIEDKKTTLKLIPILALEQSALPSGKWKPKVGDEAVIGYNYQRGLLIAPNSSIYKKISSYHTDIEWVHPDIFASLLSFNGHPSPLLEDFKHFSRTNNIGTISFMFDKSIITVDAQSFKILKNKSTSVSSEKQKTPFYTRVPHIEANWFGEGSDEIKDYDAYYINLIAQNNPDNEWIQTYKKSREKALELKNKSSWFDSWFGGLNVEFENDKKKD